MNSDQARMARALVQLGVREIAAQASVTPNTISRIENGSDPKQSTIEAVKAVYVALGVQFLDGGQAGDSATVARRG
jgi:transcriptional regulator with XRE-family HTH domain